MDKKVVIATAIAASFGAGFIKGWSSCNGSVIKRVKAQQEVPFKIITDILTRAIEDDCTPQEVRRMLNEGTEFIKISKQM